MEVGRLPDQGFLSHIQHVARNSSWCLLLKVNPVLLLLFFPTRDACVCALGAPPAGSGGRIVWKLWRRHGERLHNTARNHGVHAGAVWKFMEGQPFLPRRGKPGPQRSLHCKLTMDIRSCVRSPSSTNYRWWQLLPFQLNPHRVTWARKRCAVLTQELFSRCHAEVSFQQYYDWCVFDACGWVTRLITALWLWDLHCASSSSAALNAKNPSKYNGVCISDSFYYLGSFLFYFAVHIL